MEDCQNITEVVYSTGEGEHTGFKFECLGTLHFVSKVVGEMIPIPSRTNLTVWLAWVEANQSSTLIEKDFRFLEMI